MDLSHGEYCPVSIGARLVADRWTVMVIRELMVGSHQFNKIHRGLPGLSRSLLVNRLRHLEKIGVVERVPVTTGRSTLEYYLTAAGHDLADVVYGLGGWAARWWFPEPGPADVDNGMLLWRMRGGVNPRTVPAGRTVVGFTFTDGDLRRGWLVIESASASVCLQDPEFEADLHVTASGQALYAVWFGHQTLVQAQTEGLVTLDGAADMVRAFPTWFNFSRFAPQIAAQHRPTARTAKGRL